MRSSGNISSGYISHANEATDFKLFPFFIRLFFYFKSFHYQKKKSSPYKFKNHRCLDKVSLFSFWTDFHLSTKYLLLTQIKKWSVFDLSFENMKYSRLKM